MKRPAVVIRLIGLLAAASLVSVGCGGGDEALPDSADRARPAESKPMAEATPEPAKPPQASTTPSPTAGAAIAEQLSETIELPDYYPADGPVYPDAKPSKAQQTPAGRVSIVFGTDDSVEDASRTMTGEAESKGWSIDSEDEIERGFLTRASKDGRALMILTNRMDDGDDSVTLVAVSVDP